MTPNQPTFSLDACMNMGGWQTKPLPNRATGSIGLHKNNLSLLRCSTGNDKLFGEDRLEFLQNSGETLLGMESLAALLENQDLIPDDWKLTVGNKTVRITFDGDVLISPDGRGTRMVPFLYWDGREFRKGIQQLNASFASTCLSAVCIADNAEDT